MRKFRCSYMCTDKNTCINEIGYMSSCASLSTLKLMLSKTCISVHTEVGGHLQDQVKCPFTPSDLCAGKKQAGLQFKILHAWTLVYTSRYLHWLHTHTCHRVHQGLADSALKVRFGPCLILSIKFFHTQSNPVIYSLSVAAFLP